VPTPAFHRSVNHFSALAILSLLAGPLLYSCRQEWCLGPWRDWSYAVGWILLGGFYSRIFYRQLGGMKSILFVAYFYRLVFIASIGLFAGGLLILITLLSR